MEFNLKVIREEKGLTQTRLSEISGVDRITINRIENGKLKVTTSGTLMKLANALETSVDSLIKS